MVNDWAKERCFKKNLKEKGGKKVYVQCRNFRAKLQADEDINGAIKKCGCDGICLFLYTNFKFCFVMLLIRALSYLTALP